VAGESRLALDYVLIKELIAIRVGSLLNLIIRNLSMAARYEETTY